jgi:hypothetical protein
VTHVRARLHPSERRLRRVPGQARSTPRGRAVPRDGDEAVVAGCTIWCGGTRAGVLAAGLFGSHPGLGLGHFQEGAGLDPGVVAGVGGGRPVALAAGADQHAPLLEEGEGDAGPGPRQARVGAEVGQAEAAGAPGLGRVGDLLEGPGRASALVRPAPAER